MWPTMLQVRYTLRPIGYLHLCLLYYCECNLYKILMNKKKSSLQARGLGPDKIFPVDL